MCSHRKDGDAKGPNNDNDNIYIHIHSYDTHTHTHTHTHTQREVLQKKPIIGGKETYYSGKRDLF
jgi:hypothetical protein